MPTSKIPELLASQKPALLDRWIAAQLAAHTHRADLLSEGELRKDCARFLELLSTASRGNTQDLRSPILADLRLMLDDLSKLRSRQGFTPSETATFVFSFKEPLFAALRDAHASDAKALSDDIWTATSLLDGLGLYTTETYQSAREEVIRRQQDEMLELSTPVVRLWEGVLAVPLIGTLDSNRTSVVMEALLTAIVETRSEIAIVDITGVPTVDTLVAQHLLKTVAAARLMGADCIISGIRPQIAQTMVHLQIDLTAVITKATLAEALQVALRRTGWRVVRTEGQK